MHFSSLSARQFMFLTALFVIGDTILYVPSNVAFVAGQDAWISGLIASCAGLLLVSLYGILGKQYPRMLLIDICESAFGRFLGKAVGLWVILFFFIDSGVLLWQIGDFMSTHILMATPIQACLILFIAIIVMGVRLGLDVLGRASEIIFGWSVVLFVLFVVMLSPNFEGRHIQPLAENGLSPIVRGSFLLVGYYLESFILISLFPYFKHTGSLSNVLRKGMLIGSSVLALTILTCILVLGKDMTVINIFPTYILAQKISIGGILERIEVVIASIWIFTLYFKLSLCFHAAIRETAQLLKVKDYKILSFPSAVLVVAVSLILVPNVSYFNTLIIQTWWPYTLTQGLLLPLLLLGIPKVKSLVSASKR